MHVLGKVSFIFTFTKQRNTKSVLALAQENETNDINFLRDSLNYMCRSQSQSFPTVDYDTGILCLYMCHQCMYHSDLKAPTLEK